MILMHQLFLVSETEMKSAGIYSVLMYVHHWIAAVHLLLNLSQARVLTEKKPKV